MEKKVTGSATAAACLPLSVMFAATLSEVRRRGGATTSQLHLPWELLGRHAALMQMRQDRFRVCMQARGQSSTSAGEEPEVSSSLGTSPPTGTGRRKEISIKGHGLRRRLAQLSIVLATGSSTQREKGKTWGKDFYRNAIRRQRRDRLDERARRRLKDFAEQVGKRISASASRERLRHMQSTGRPLRRTEGKIAGADRRTTQDIAQGKSSHTKDLFAFKNEAREAELERQAEEARKETEAEAEKASKEKVDPQWRHIIDHLLNEAESASPTGSTDTSPSEERQRAEKVAKFDRQGRDLPPHLKLNLNEHNARQIPSRTGERGHNGMKSGVNGDPSEPQSMLLRGPSLSTHRRVKAQQASMKAARSSAANYLPVEQVPAMEDEKRKWWDEEAKWNTTVGGRMFASEIAVERVSPLREMQVPRLAHGLDRVLFNPGVHWLRDFRSGIYNFDPRIRNLYDVDLFDYSSLPPYMTSSKDPELAELMRRTRKKYSGSTSSMTSLLSQIYFLISAWRQPDLTGFSAGFDSFAKTFSFGAKLPASVILRRFEEQVEGSTRVRYAIDADKGDSDQNSNYVLLNLGKSMEKLLTSRPEEYERYLRVNSHVLSPEEKIKPEAYHYASTGKLLMRSQLDCYDERLPRKTFDLKTRAVMAVRHDRANWVESSGYMIRHATGVFESFEREMWDMTRAAMLKYWFQARIGNMDGIMVAYHSTATMFGFQYLPCEDMAMRLFSSVEMGEQAFKLSLGLLERILDTITDLKPSHSLRLTMDTELGQNPKMLMFAQAEDNDGTPTREGELLQLDVQVDRYLSNALVKGPVDFSLPYGYGVDDASEDEIRRRERADLPPLNWSVEYSVSPRSDLSTATTREHLRKIQARLETVAPLILPNLEALNEREQMRERELSKNEAALQQFYDDRRSGAASGMPVVPGQVTAKERIVRVGTGEGELDSANADLKENERGEAPSSGQQATQQWKKVTPSIDRLRELARLGKADKQLQELTDRLEVYERRDE